MMTRARCKSLGLKPVDTNELLGRTPPPPFRRIEEKQNKTGLRASESKVHANLNETPDILPPIRRLVCLEAVQPVPNLSGTTAARGIRVEDALRCARRAPKTYLHDGLHGRDVLLSADDRDHFLLDLDHALHDERLQDLRVLGPLGHRRDLLRRGREQVLEENVPRGHLLHARVPDHRGSRAGQPRHGSGSESNHHRKQAKRAEREEARYRFRVLLFN